MGNLSVGNTSSYYDYARRQNVFTALALVTAPVIYSTAAGTGGPLLWNNTGIAGNVSRVLAVLLAVSVGVTTASAAASVLGITGNSGQTSAPSATTAIDASGNAFVGGPKPLCTLFRVGTVSTAGSFFMPTHPLDTTALTAIPPAPAWQDLHGSIVVPPGSWAAVASGATATSAVCQIGLMWAEIPL